MLASGRTTWSVGDKVRVYRTTHGYGAVAPEAEDLAAARDYDVEHYVRVLRDNFASRLVRALSAEDFAAVFDRQIAEITARLGTASRWSLAHRDLARLREHLETMPSRDLSIEGPALWPLGAALSRVTGWRARLRVLRWVLLPGRGYLAHRGLETSGLSSRVLASARRLANRLSRAR